MSTPSVISEATCSLWQSLPQLGSLCDRVEQSPALSPTRSTQIRQLLDWEINFHCDELLRVGSLLQHLSLPSPTGSHSVAPGPAAPASPGDVLEVPTLRCHLRSAQSENSGVGASFWCFNRLPGHSDAHSGLKLPVPPPLHLSVIAPDWRAKLGTASCPPPLDSQGPVAEHSSDTCSNS